MSAIDLLREKAASAGELALIACVEREVRDELDGAAAKAAELLAKAKRHEEWSEFLSKELDLWVRRVCHADHRLRPPSVASLRERFDERNAKGGAR